MGDDNGANPSYAPLPLSASNPLFAKGYNGHIYFDGAFVTIQRKGLVGRISAGKGNRRIPFISIQAVQWKPPGSVLNGFISFTIAGAIEKNRGFGAATFDATHDENAVMFRGSQQRAMLTMRDAIELAIANHHGLNRAQVVQATPTTAASISEEIARLGELRESGMLTDDEFAAAKQRIIGG